MSTDNAETYQPTQGGSEVASASETPKARETTAHVENKDEVQVPNELGEPQDQDQDKPKTLKKLGEGDVAAPFADAAKCQHEWLADGGQSVSVPRTVDGYTSGVDVAVEYECAKCGSTLKLKQSQPQEA